METPLSGPVKLEGVLSAPAQRLARVENSFTLRGRTLVNSGARISDMGGMKIGSRPESLVLVNLGNFRF